MRVITGLSITGVPIPPLRQSALIGVNLRLTRIFFSLFSSLNT